MDRIPRTNTWEGNEITVVAFPRIRVNTNPPKISYEEFIKERREYISDYLLVSDYDEITETEELKVIKNEDSNDDLPELEEVQI